MSRILDEQALGPSFDCLRFLIHDLLNYDVKLWMNTSRSRKHSDYRTLFFDGVRSLWNKFLASPYLIRSRIVPALPCTAPLLSIASFFSAEKSCSVPKKLKLENRQDLSTSPFFSSCLNFDGGRLNASVNSFLPCSLILCSTSFALSPLLNASVLKGFILTSATEQTDSSSAVIDLQQTSQ